MFDNTKPNVILISDQTDVLSMHKTIGPFAVANSLRLHGFEVAVIHHASVFTIEEIQRLLISLVSEYTLFVGFNNFFYQNISNFEFNDKEGIRLNMSDAGAMIPHGKQYNKLLKNCIKNVNANCKIVLGGPSSADAHWNRDFDYVVFGYAESSVVNLAQHLSDKSIELKKSYRSIYGPIVINDSRAENFDFSNSYISYCDHDVILHGESLTIEIARGCIFSCKFCSYPMNGKKKLDYIRHKNLIITEMIENYKKFGVTRYLFSDDTVNDSVEKCQMIYEISQSLPFKLEWWGYIRLDLMAAHPETQDLLFNGGLTLAYFGIETLNTKTAAIIGKGGNRQKLIDTLVDIKSKWKDKVTLHGSFIYGLPHEDLDSINQTTEFLLSDQNPLDSWIVHALRIRRDIDLTNGFVSDIERNWQKYGYENTGSLYPENSNVMLWKNQHFDYLSILDLVNNVMKRNKQKSKLSGWWIIQVVGLGFTLDKFMNKKYDDIDWHQLDKVKLQRSVEYKQKVFKVLKVDPINNYDQKFFDNVQTFSNFLVRERSKKSLEVVV